MLLNRLLDIRSIYPIVFLSLAAWAFFAYITLAEQIQGQQIYAKIINLSGKQRMLSQKTALITTRVFLQQQDALRPERDNLIETMKAEHAFILNHLPSAAMQAFYFGPDTSLESKTQAYFDLLDNPPVGPVEDYVNAVQHASFELLPLLNDAVYAFENEANQKTQALKDRETLILLGTLTTLILESLFIVLPALRNSARRQRIIDEERQKLKLFMDLSSDAIFILEVETGRVRDYSKLARIYLGYTDEEMKHLSVFDWDREVTSLDEFRALTQQIGDSPYVFERVHSRKDGSTYIASVSIVRVTFSGKEYFSTSVRDITEQKNQIEIRLREQAQLKSITDNSLDAIVMMDPQGKVSFWNPSAERVLGHSAAEAIGQDLHRLIAPPHYLPAFKRGFETFAQTGTGSAVGRQIDLQAVHKKGHEIAVDLVINSIQSDNQWHALGIIRDVTDKKASDALIRRQKEELETIFNTSLEGIAVLDLDTRYIKVNQHYEKLFGYSQQEFSALSSYDITTTESLEECRKTFQEVIDTGAVENYERTCIRKDGERRRITSSITLMPDGQHFLVTSSDVTERYDLLNQLQQQSVTDELTQLHNRKAFNVRMAEAIAQYRRFNTTFSVVMLDIDHFKSINDSYGHQVGDEVLVALSNTLRSSIRKTDYAYRLGGEEFMILLTGTGLQQATVLAEKLRQRVQSRVKAAEDRHVTISLGVAEFSTDDDHDRLVKRADENLYKAKYAGRNRVVF